MKTADVSQSIYGDVALFHRATEPVGQIMDVYHAANLCHINVEDKATLLLFASGALNPQKCDMLNPQQNIAAWIEAMLKKHDLSVRTWAVKAKVSRESVRRARDPAYQFATSTSTLQKLANVIGEQPPLSSQAPRPAVPAFSVEVMTGIVSEILDTLAPGVPHDEVAIRTVAKALRDILAALAANPDAASAPVASRAVARALIQRLEL